MNDQSETTASPSEPKLCKMGCGFFGSNATGDCCSKCYNEILKKEGSTATSPTTCVAVTSTSTAAPAAAVTTTTSNTSSTETPTATVAEPTPAEPQKKKKKKKKKMSYKNMMAGMLEQSGPRDEAKEKEGIKKVTGGGAFSKIDKI